MSSHREAPEISKVPVADNTDVYAFVSPDKPDTVTIIANFIPFQNPYDKPNFYEFGDDMLYQIHISNSGTDKADLQRQARDGRAVGAAFGWCQKARAQLVQQIGRRNLRGVHRPRRGPRERHEQ